ncbi:MAG: SpoIIE family protein phosphatase [Bryobacteraceae bacterium]|nr:SpoIIE family protein phosphatase [Bryobacteraceae bacterium]
MPNVDITQLEIRLSDGSRQSLALEKDEYSLGRAATNDLSFPDDIGLSRQHLVFERATGGWKARDLGSKNGTLLNGLPLKGSAMLQPGDLITCGQLSMSYAPPQDRTVVFSPSGMAPQGTIFTSLAGALSTAASPSGLARQVDALVRAGQELAGHRPLSELFGLILNLALDAVEASRGVLMTWDGHQLVAQAARGDHFEISTFVRNQVMEERKSLLVPDTLLDSALREQVSIVQQQIRSLLAVPLQTSDRVIGLLYVDGSGFVRPFTPEDLSLLTVLANIAAIRIEQARLLEVEIAEAALLRDMEQAAELQRKLLPGAAPLLDGYLLEGYNLPCRTVGGDYYDFVPYSDGRLAILVGDVSGKGMPAALLMSSLQTAVHLLAEDSPEPLVMVNRLNRLLCAKKLGNRFVTFFFGVLDPSTGVLEYVNAGHNPPLLLRADGSLEELAATGMILGILTIASYASAATQLGTGDRLVLFSDGITEAAPPADLDNEFGEARLSDLARSRVTMEEISGQVLTWCAGETTDDLTLVIVDRL